MQELIVAGQIYEFMYFPQLYKHIYLNYGYCPLLASDDSQVPAEKL